MNAPVRSNPVAAVQTLFETWRRPIRQLHWISAALCLFSLCFYALTGFLLNNEDLVKATARTSHAEMAMAEPLASRLADLKNDQLLAADDARTLEAQLGVDMRYAKARVTKGKVMITIPEPGIRHSLEVNAKSGKLVYDRTDRGAAAFLTDLHKGKNVRPLWHWFINLFAVSVLVFALSGLVLLGYQAKSRQSTWPLAAGGIAIPVLFFVIMMHL